jgi:hypothetical protein
MLRVAKEGYSPSMATASSNSAGRAQWAYIQLDALAAPVDIAGEYTLTFVAGTACTGLPTELRTRTYDASIALADDSHLQTGTSLALTVRGASFVGEHHGFPIGVAGDTVTFSIYYRQEDFGVVEQTASGTFVAIQGSATISVASAPIATIATSLNGIIDYCAVPSGSSWTYECNSGPRVAYEHCVSDDHQLILTRR